MAERNIKFYIYILNLTKLYVENCIHTYANFKMIFQLLYFCLLKAMTFVIVKK